MNCGIISILAAWLQNGPPALPERCTTRAKPHFRSFDLKTRKFGPERTLSDPRERLLHTLYHYLLLHAQGWSPPPPPPPPPLCSSWHAPFSCGGTQAPRRMGVRSAHRGTRHLRAAEAKKGTLLRGDPDAIKNDFFIAARSLDVRSPWWCGKPSDSGGRHVKGEHVKDAANAAFQGAEKSNAAARGDPDASPPPPTPALR